MTHPAGCKQRCFAMHGVSPWMLAYSLVGCLLAASSLVASSEADTVVLKDGAVHHGGVELQSDMEVVLRVQDSDGREHSLRWPREDVQWVLLSAAQQRLDSLDPQQPLQCLEYAEELAARSTDPESRRVARELYARAAEIEPRNFGRSSMLGLAALSDDPDEARHYRAAAYLLDPMHDARLLSPVASPDPSQGRQLATSAIRLLRRGAAADAVEARRLLQLEEVQSQIKSLGRLLTVDDLLNLCDAACLECDGQSAMCPTCRGTGESPVGQPCSTCGRPPEGGRPTGRIACPVCQGRSQASLRGMRHRLISAELRLLYGTRTPSDSGGWGQVWGAGNLKPVKALPTSRR